MVWRSGRSYPVDLRLRVLSAVDGGMRVPEAAAVFGVSVSYAYKALARRKATGETAPRAQRGHQTPKLAAHHEAIAAEVRRRPDATIAELRAWLLETHGIAASTGLMHNTLVRLGLTRKKSPDGHKSRTVPTSPCEENTGGRNRRS
jgi:transposase